MVTDRNSVGFAGEKYFAHTPTVVEEDFLIWAFARGCLYLTFLVLNLHEVFIRDYVFKKHLLKLFIAFWNLIFEQLLLGQRIVNS